MDTTILLWLLAGVLVLVGLLGLLLPGLPGAPLLFAGLLVAAWTEDFAYVGVWSLTLIAVLAPIILIHELGHFIFAKLAGVRVEEFGFGYPPRMLRLWRSQGYLDIGVMRLVIPAGFRLPREMSVDTYVDAIAREQDDGTFTLRDITVLRPTIEYPE